MIDKKIQENPLPESNPQPEADKPAPKLAEMPTPVPVTPPAPTTPRLSMPSFTKTPPNDLSKRLLPAVLFLLTFVAVMTMLLMYMDTVALGAQQFRLNMSRDYELARIPQESAPLVAYVRQLHLAPRANKHEPTAPPQPTDKINIIDKYCDQYNGTFVEFLARGPRDPSTLYLESARGWGGVVVRAAARDYLSLRGAAPNTRSLHACLSPTDHPREVTYPEAESQETGGGAFRSRVLCLPLYTVLLAAEATRAHYLLLAGDAAHQALAHLPLHTCHIQIIEVFSSDASTRNKTTQLLTANNYTVAATFHDSLMYALVSNV